LAGAFSPNTKEQFLDYLRSIRESISTEHIEAIREVYGATAWQVFQVRKTKARKPPFHVAFKWRRRPRRKKYRDANFCVNP
jgi:hypothetical protein